MGSEMCIRDRCSGPRAALCLLTSTPSDSRELGWLDFPSLALSAAVGGRHTGQPCSDADPSCRACSGADPNMVIVLDEIAIPADIPAGDYVLGFRAPPVRCSVSLASLRPHYWPVARGQAGTAR